MNALAPLRRINFTALALFASGFAWALAYALLLNHAAAEEPYAEEPDIAAHLARGEGFSSPLVDGPAAPPTSWSAPAYPAIAAGIYKMLGVGSVPSRWALLALNAAALGASAAALYILARRRLPRRTALLAAILFLLHPILIHIVLQYWDAHLALALFLWIAVWADGVDAATPRARLWHAAGIGLASGLLLLTNSVYVLAIPLVWGRLAWQHKRLRIAPFATALAACALALLPWTLRNSSTFGKLFFIRAGSGLELWIGNLEGTHGLSSELLRHHPYVEKDEKAQYLSRGEMAYFQYCRERFDAGLRARPAAFAKRSAERAAWLFLGDPWYRDDHGHPLLSYTLLPAVNIHGFVILPLCFNVLFTALAIAGAVMLRRESRRGGWLIACALLSVAPYVFTHVDDRYAIALRSLMAIFVAVAVMRLVECRKKPAAPA